MEQIDETLQTALIEMFKRVGLDYTFDQILEYAKDPEWYWSRTWTLKQTVDFEAWLYDLFYKSKQFKEYTAKARKRLIKKEVGYFMLMWSWKTELPSNADSGKKKENE